MCSFYVIICDRILKEIKIVATIEKKSSKINHQDFKTQLQYYYPSGCLKFGLGSSKANNGKVSSTVYEKING